MAEKELSVSQTPDFTLEDFQTGRVFEYLYNIKNPYQQALEESKLYARSRAVGFTGFKKCYTRYAEQRAKEKKPVISQDNKADLEEAPEFSTGEWTVDEMGVFRPSKSSGQMEVACSHPIFPARRLRSIDTSMIKYELRFKRGGNTSRASWTPVLIDACDMASPTKIVDRLSPYGVSVTGGDRAKAMVDYLRDVTDINYDVIPEVKCVSRVGWNEEGFAPYNGDIEFDGAKAFADAYKAIGERGSFDKWLEEALDARTYSLTARIVLAASFASPLVEPLGISPFFVHLWSTASGTGKTVGQMLGASVWADPSPGGAFFPTFRSTSVGFEMIAGFLHSLPLFIDELQLAKDHHGKINFNVYELASGSGKLRSNKSLGLNYTPKWAMVFITSGETPIVSDNDGEGAINRVFEIECMADDLVIKDGHRTANALKQNYGFAGKMFVKHLMSEGIIDAARETYDSFFQQCAAQSTTEKQAMAAAALLTADKIATEFIFKDGKALTVEEISEFLKTKERVSLMQRGYEALCDWINIHASRLKGIQDGDKNECYGIVEDVNADGTGGGTAYIIKSVFDKFCMDNELNPKGFLSHLKTRRLIDTGLKGYTKTHYLGSYNRAQCVCVKLPKDDGTENSEFTQEYPVIANDYEPLPF